MEIGAKDFRSQRRRHVNSCCLTMVAVEHAGRPAVPARYELESSSRGRCLFMMAVTCLTVQESVQPVKEFKVQTESGEQPALIALKHAEKYQLTADDPECAEYFVRVKWLDTVPENKAVNEVGLFGSQNTVCQPTTPKWRHTVDRLKVAFPQWSA